MSTLVFRGDYRCIGMIDAGFWSLTGNTIKVVPEKITGSIGQRGIV